MIHNVADFFVRNRHLKFVSERDTTQYLRGAVGDVAAGVRDGPESGAAAGLSPGGGAGETPTQAQAGR